MKLKLVICQGHVRSQNKSFPENSIWGGCGVIGAGGCPEICLDSSNCAGLGTQGASAPYRYQTQRVSGAVPAKYSNRRGTQLVS